MQRARRQSLLITLWSWNEQVCSSECRFPHLNSALSKITVRTERGPGEIQLLVMSNHACPASLQASLTRGAEWVGSHYIPRCLVLKMRTLLHPLSPFLCSSSHQCQSSWRSRSQHKILCSKGASWPTGTQALLFKASASEKRLKGRYYLWA